MAEFFLTIDASSVYATDAPILEVVIDGSVKSSIEILSGFTTSTYKISYSGSKPPSFELRFNDASGEGGRSITLNDVSVSGQNINSNLSSLLLLQNESSSVNITNTDYLYGKINPTAAEMGTPTIEGENINNDTDILNGTTGDDIIFGYNGFNKVYAGEGNDTFRGGNQIDYVFGEAGNDFIFAGRGNDRILGGDGDDLIYSHNDHDFVRGDAGNDTINLGAGNDRGYGGVGDDIIIGGSGNDLIFGDAGEDRIEAGSGNDKIYGGSEDDDLYGSNGYDWLYGGAGDDYLAGGNQSDRLFGDDGVDRLRGGNGDDWLFGGAGNDDVRGGNDDDELTGGAGVDRLRGEAGDDLLFYDSEDNFWGGTGFDWLVMQETDSSNIDFSDAKIRSGIEGVTLINWNGGNQANEISLDAADIIANSDLDYLFIAGDIGQDSVVSTDYDISDRSGGNVRRGGHEYARFEDGGTDLYIEIGLTLNGVAIV